MEEALAGAAPEEGSGPVAEAGEQIEDLGELIKEAEVKKWSTYHYKKKYIALYEKCLFLQNSKGSSIKKLRKSIKEKAKRNIRKGTAQPAHSTTDKEQSDAKPDKEPS